MDTKSISQGTFISLPPGFNLSKFKRRKKQQSASLEYNDPWEMAFESIWENLLKQFKGMNQKLFGKVLEELLTHVGKLHKEISATSGAIPCELLLTGTNLPDHKLLLDSLYSGLTRKVSPHVATLWAQDCVTARATVACLVRQIVGCVTGPPPDSDDSDFDDDKPEAKKPRLQATQLCLKTLTAWYEESSVEKNSIIIVVPDFESFTPSVLADVFGMLSAYARRLPLILILGVATSPAMVYQTLPRTTLAHLSIQLFQSEASPTLLNHVIEKILLDEKCPFRLGGKTMTFLTDVFLFHSFSVQRFFQGYKYCMLEHFYMRPHMILCCPEKNVDKAVQQLSPNGLENLRKLASFQKYVESQELSERKSLLLNDNYLKGAVTQQLHALHAHKNDFIVALKCLHLLSRDLPGFPLGRHVRELYCKAASTTIRSTSEFKQCISLLRMQSRSELSSKVSAVLNLLKIDSILDILEEEKNRFDPVIGRLESLLKEMELVAASADAETNGEAATFEMVRKQLVHTLEKELLSAFLKPPTKFPLHEILYFDDLASVRRRIAGAPRSAIHNALTNPHFYLECSCCELPNADAVLASLPDVSIAYKLYLESNKTINLFDWLQSFAAVLKPDVSEKPDQEMQARFTRAVSELQFLGFIKPSKAKSDTVTRLTFGNC